MTNLDSILKSRHITLGNEGLYSQSYGFSSSHVWIWELYHKESWVPKTWCFWTVMLEKTLESLLACKEIQPVNLKGNQSWIFSWVPLPYYSPPGCPFPIKSLALSAHVSPWTIHSWVSDKSPLSGPGSVLPFCNKHRSLECPPWQQRVTTPALSHWMSRRTAEIHRWRAFKKHKHFPT